MAPPNPLRVSQKDADDGVQHVARIGAAVYVGQALYSVLKLGVPDLLGADSMTIAEIAAKLPGTPNVDMLSRALRFLASETGLFVETVGQSGEAVFRLSKQGAVLQMDVEGQPSLACAMLTWLDSGVWRALGQLSTCLAGKLATDPFTAANGKPLHEYCHDHPESSAAYQEFMSVLAGPECLMLSELYNWKSLKGKTVVEISDCGQSALEALKRKFPTITGMSLNVADILDSAKADLLEGVKGEKGEDGSKGKTPWLAALGSDRFNPAMIPRADGVIYLNHALRLRTHRACVKILRCCHSALLADGKVVITDVVMTKIGEANRLKANQTFGDVFAGIVSNSGYRTKVQWETLAAEAGFELESVIMVPLPFCQVLTLTKVKVKS